MVHVKLYPPAKINLHLEVGPVGTGGYHDLRSICIKLNLKDEMDVIITDAGYILECDSLKKLQKDDDLLYRAMIFFQNYTGISFGLAIKLKKNIPMQGGLGGGSSDAGVLLSFLYEHFAPLIHKDQLIKDSVNVGADVPFFLHSCYAAYIGGLGEQITPIVPKKLHFLLCFPNFGIPTGEAYGYLDCYDSHWSVLEKDVLIKSWNMQMSEWPFFNSFSHKLKKEYPGFAKVENFLSQFHLDFFTLSGSGSTYAVCGDSAVLSTITQSKSMPGMRYLNGVEALVGEHQN
ncbi:MAG: 4-(cytidine 5'-diphospho)-2-C-methyl-D-erythritol kinase [Spirochaetia bacterium]